MKAKQQLLQLTPYKPGKPIEEVKKEFGLEKIVKLASNENPYGSSPSVQEAIKAEAENLAIYPDGYSATLRTALAAFLNVQEENLIFGNGSDEIVQILSRSYLSEGTNTVMAAPTFPQYKHNAIIEGAEIREVPLVNGEHDLEAMLKAIDEDTRIVWLCSPNNPSGTYISKKSFEQFMKNVPSHVLVVSDEAYYEYVAAPDYPETVPFLKQFSNLIVLRTFSKAYGLAALRVGYGIASKEIISSIEPAREPFNTSRIAQAAAKAALEDEAFIQTCFDKNRKGLQQFYDFCEAEKLGYFPSQANFILIDIYENADSLFQYLLERGYIVRWGTALGYPTGVRITVGNEEQNSEIIQHIRAFLASKRTAEKV